MAISRPGFDTGSLHLPAGFWAFTATTAASLAALAGVGWLVAGSPQAALAKLQGVALTTSPDHVDFGTGAPGQVLERSVEVRNWTDRPVRLIGGTADCSCVTTADLPLTIPPGAARQLTVRLRIPRAKLGALTRVAELWTDADDLRIIQLQIGCRVVE